MPELRYIEVILPLRLEWNPSYSVPRETTISLGSRVKVLFAGRKYIGVVSALDTQAPTEASKIIPIISVEDRLPKISNSELRFWAFISEYYLCTIGEVYKSAYPAVKTHSEEHAIALAQRAKEKQDKAYQLFKRKIERLTERLNNKDTAISKPHGEKVQSRLLSEREQILSQLNIAKQELESFIQQNPDILSSENHSNQQTSENKAQKNETQSNNPINANIIPEINKPLVLDNLNRREIYMTLTQQVLNQGFNVLILIPENDYSKHILNLCHSYSIENTLIYNSRQSASSRQAAADMLRKDQGPFVIIGTRSSLYLPYTRLGLIVVDEEHDPLYKQTEATPRINARDCAAVLASIHGAGLILSSLTPTLESIYNCKIGKYSLYQECSNDLTTKVQNSSTSIIAKRNKPLCTQLIDISSEKRKNGMIGPFSRILKQAISTTEGRIILIRTWENPQDLDQLTKELFEDRKIEIMTPLSAKRISPDETIALIAILQADALFPSEDFRADERALQTLRQIGSHAERYIIQTAKSKHPVFQALAKGEDSSILMEERKAFALPPYTKLIDILINDNNLSRKALMTRRLYSALKLNSLRIVIDRGAKLSEYKSSLLKSISSFERDNKYYGHIRLDVDPQ